MLTNFKIGLVDYRKVITSILNITYLTKLKEVAQNGEDNCIDVSGRKVKLDIQSVGPS